MRAGTTFNWLMMVMLGFGVALYTGCETPSDDDDDDAVGDDDDNTGDDDDTTDDDDDTTDDDDDTTDDDDDTTDDDDDSADDDDDSADDDDDSAADDDDDDTMSTWPSSFVGSMNYTDSRDGVTECDMAIDLVGTTYTGACVDCDFAFEITPTVTADLSTPDCQQRPEYTYMPSADTFPVMMGHMPSYYGWYTYTDVFTTGLAYQGYYYYPGPYFRHISYDGHPYGTFTRTGDDIEWSFTQSFNYSYNYALTSPYASNYCNYYPWSYATTNYGGSYVGTSDVDCNGEVVDIWSFDGDANASTYSVSVDTVSDPTAFDPQFIINDSLGCTVMSADDNFTCTYVPQAFSCPSAEITVTPGTHYVKVQSLGSCNGLTAEYEILVDAPADPNLTLLQDDLSVYDSYLYELYFYGSGTITP